MPTNDGSDLLLFISADGTASGAKTAVELQGDLTINTGKSITQTPYKNGQAAHHSKSGWSATTTIGNQAPMGAGQALVFAAHDNETKTYFWVQNGETGGVEYEGECKIAISTINAPTSGGTTSQITIAADGAEPTRSVAT